MKEPVLIICQHCGKKTPEAAACRNCGKDIESLQGLEVQYKDFKGSEMLDIKMASHVRQGDEKQAQNNKEAAGKSSRSEKKSAGMKAVFFFWATIGIILSALAWYFLLKFLPKF